MQTEETSITITTTLAALRKAVKGAGTITTQQLARSLGADSPRTLPIQKSKVRNALVGCPRGCEVTVEINTTPNPSKAKGWNKDARKADQHKRCGEYETIIVTVPADRRTFRLFGFPPV